MQRSNSDYLHKYALPSGVATNSQELRLLQKKLLQNNYQSQKPSLRREFPAPEELQKSRQLQQFDFEKQQTQKQLKESLSSDLNEQIRIKNQQSQLSRQQNMSQESHLMKHLNRIDELEKQKQKQFNRKFKEEAQQDLKLKNINRMREAKYNQAEKEFFRDRYSVGDLTQSYRQKNNTYSNPTQQYTKEIDKAMFTRQDKIVNPEHIKNSNFKITRRADNLSALDFMFHGAEHHSSYQQQNNIFKQMKDKESKEKGELKATLLAQIREKETTRKTEKRNDFYNPYTSRDYNFKHHPINNPIDYRLAHDNRYVMKQLGTIQ